VNKIGAASPVTSVPIASPLLVSSISPLCLFHGISRSQIWLVVVLLYRSCVLFLYIASLLSSPWAWENQYLSFFFSGWFIAHNLCWSWGWWLGWPHWPLVATLLRVFPNEDLGRQRHGTDLQCRIFVHRLRRRSLQLHYGSGLAWLSGRPIRAGAIGWVCPAKM
jgi:hypothetical protein